MDVKPVASESKPSKDLVASPYSASSKTPSAQPVQMVAETQRQGDSSFSTSSVLLYINLGLLAMFFAVMWYSGGYRYLTGFEVGKGETSGLGLFEAIEEGITISVRLALYPAVSLLAVVGSAFAFGSISSRRRQPLKLRLPSIVLLVFHFLCLVPPLIFLIRILFVALKI